MAQHIAILQSNSDVILEMESCLKELLPTFEHCFFDNAGEMIGWLKERLADVSLISLDHDLPIVQYRNGRRVEAGCGRTVAEYLASVPPTCPVILHTSNSDRGTNMEQVLKDSGWPYRRVLPFGDFEWIGKAWRPELERFIREGWIK
jgi:hypothetical protein